VITQELVTLGDEISPRPKWPCTWISQCPPTTYDVVISGTVWGAPTVAASPIWERWCRGKPEAKNLWAAYAPNGREAWLDLVCRQRRRPGPGTQRRTGLATLLMESLDDEASDLHEACGRMAAITEALLTAAREAGAIRSDVTAADIHALMNAAAWMREQVQEEQAEHLLELLVNGLRPGGDDT
jgi:hypothetical protein